MKLRMYYAYVGDQVIGPVTPGQLREMYDGGQINNDTQVCSSDDQSWIPFRYCSQSPDREWGEKARMSQIERNAANATTPVAAASNQNLQAAGKGLQALGVAVTLVNPIVGVGMIVAGSKVKKAGES